MYSITTISEKSFAGLKKTIKGLSVLRDFSMQATIFSTPVIIDKPVPVNEEHQRIKNKNNLLNELAKYITEENLTKRFDNIIPNLSSFLINKFKI